MTTPVYTLAQLRAAAAADYGYEEFCRRMGLLISGPAAWESYMRWTSWKVMCREMLKLTPDQLARLLADERPMDVAEILEREA